MQKERNAVTEDATGEVDWEVRRRQWSSRRGRRSGSETGLPAALGPGWCQQG